MHLLSCDLWKNGGGVVLTNLRISGTASIILQMGRIFCLGCSPVECHASAELLSVEEWWVRSLSQLCSRPHLRARLAHCAHPGTALWASSLYSTSIQSDNMQELCQCEKACLLSSDLRENGWWHSWSIAHLGSASAQHDGDI